MAVIRRERPQVVITYGDNQTEYPHPDHLRVHEISVLAFDLAGDPDRFPEAGPPFAPAKLYYSVWSGERFRAMHDKFAELGLKSPFDDKWLARMTKTEPFTTTINVRRFHPGAGRRAQGARHPGRPRRRPSGSACRLRSCATSIRSTSTAWLRAGSARST